VWMHEMGSEKFMDEQVRPAFKEDFVAMLPVNAHADVGATIQQEEKR